jgi:ferritin-like metal-binding protein YciE
MKNLIHTVQDALSFQLQGLYYSEKKVSNDLPECQRQISSPKLLDEIEKYLNTSHGKLQKLERIFNYLMKEPVSRKNDVIAKLLEEIHKTLDITESAHLRDILMIGCIQTINAYKIACYRTAYLFAIELEMDTASDLLQQILEWECETSNSLATLSINEFNKINLAADGM